MKVPTGQPTAEGDGVAEDEDDAVALAVAENVLLDVTLPVAELMPVLVAVADTVAMVEDEQVSLPTHKDGATHVSTT